MGGPCRIASSLCHGDRRLAVASTTAYETLASFSSSVDLFCEALMVVLLAMIELGSEEDHLVSAGKVLSAVRRREDEPAQPSMQWEQS